MEDTQKWSDKRHESCLMLEHIFLQPKEKNQVHTNAEWLV